MNNKIFERINDAKGLIGSPEMQQQYNEIEETIKILNEQLIEKLSIV